MGTWAKPIWRRAISSQPKSISRPWSASALSLATNTGICRGRSPNTGQPLRTEPDRAVALCGQIQAPTSACRNVCTLRSSSSGPRTPRTKSKQIRCSGSKPSSGLRPSAALSSAVLAIRAMPISRTTPATPTATHASSMPLSGSREVLLGLREVVHDQVCLAHMFMHAAVTRTERERALIVAFLPAA